ncbi:5-methyltetrahydropteroyltriglutamate--homocysteine S-methyltransferase [Microbacteriaceae bacterium K1510]|nr:5-methyltetrahydropteroyltriglutamate--homocysteine S-methyltransferase [Microbacteriaceae bacterium K1510]
MAPLAKGRPPFRTDHVGSLLRPPALKQAFRRHAAKEIDDAEFDRIMDQCIRDVVALQVEVGLQVVTDGEFRRGSYWGRFVERIEGFEIKEASFKFRNDQGHEVAFTAPYANGKIRRKQPLALDEYQFLHGATKVTGKITLPAPSTMHFYRCNDFADSTVYKDVDVFFADLAAIFKQEIAALAKAGCRYIQLDEVAVALLCDPGIRDVIATSGMQPDTLVDLYIDSINQAVAECPTEVVVGVHMCRGNFKGHYLGAGGYESVAERFFANTKVNHFLLEYDTPRAGDFAPLRFVPKGKGVVLGLISSKLPVIEHIDALKARTQEATRYIDLDRLAISPQCGFASTVAGNPVTEADQRAKLALIVQAARTIWGD